MGTVRRRTTLAAGRWWTKLERLEDLASDEAIQRQSEIRFHDQAEQDGIQITVDRQIARPAGLDRSAYSSPMASSRVRACLKNGA